MGLRHARRHRPRIGVGVRDVEMSDVTRQKLAGQNGAVIVQVESETPAARAGLKVGDVVLAFDGEGVRSARSSIGWWTKPRRGAP